MISVIIPYDRNRGYLENCITSIMNQTYKDFEIIPVCNPFPVAKNFNIGLRLAQGEFCKFVAEDDWLPINALQDLADGIKDYPWICGNAEQHDSSTWVYRPGDYAKNFLTLKENLNTNRIHGGTTLYRTELLREIGGMDESLWTGEEYDMHLKLMSLGYLPGYVDKIVYCHRLWSGQKSKQLRKNRKDERQKEISRIQSFYFDAV